MTHAKLHHVNNRSDLPTIVAKAEHMWAIISHIWWQQLAWSSYSSSNLATRQPTYSAAHTSSSRTYQHATMVTIKDGQVGLIYIQLQHSDSPHPSHKIITMNLICLYEQQPNLPRLTLANSCRVDLPTEWQERKQGRLMYSPPNIGKELIWIPIHARGTSISRHAISWLLATDSDEESASASPLSNSTEPPRPRKLLVFHQTKRKHTSQASSDTSLKKAIYSIRFLPSTQWQKAMQTPQLLASFLAVDSGHVSIFMP